MGVFSYKRVPQLAFFHSVERCDDESGGIFFMASPAKALADYLYVHSLNWTGIDEPMGSLRIDEEQLTCVTVRELNVLLENYSNGRVKRFLAGWLKEVRQ